MSSRTITFRFPEEVIEVIESQARASGRNRTAVVLEALAQFYGFSPLATAPSTLEVLQQQVYRLSAQVADLTQQLSDLRQRQPISEDGSAPAVPPILPMRRIDNFNVEENTEVRSGLGSTADLDVMATALSEQQQFILQLEHQARTLDRILSANPDVVFVLDRRGRFTYINPAGGRALGFERNYVLGKTFQELDFSIFDKAFITQCEAVFTTGQTVCDEIDIPIAHGSRSYEYILSPIYGMDGRIDAVVYTARDITERKQSELVIRESEEKYRNLFETANDAILITDLVTQHLLNVNRNAARRLGYTRQELLQLTIDDINAPLSANYKEAINQELHLNGDVTFEHWHHHKNGKEIPVEVNAYIIEYEGKLAVQSFIRDITEKKKIEERLHLLESVILNVSDAIAIVKLNLVEEPDYRVVYVNHNLTRMTGYSAEELMGGTLCFLYDSADNRTQQEQLRRMITQRQSATVQLTHYRKDNSAFRVELMLRPIVDAQGQHTYTLIFHRELPESGPTERIR